MPGPGNRPETPQEPLSQTQGYGMAPVYTIKRDGSKELQGYKFDPATAAEQGKIDVPKPDALLSAEKQLGRTLEPIYATYLKSGKHGGNTEIEYGAPIGYRYDNGKSQYVNFDASGQYQGTADRQNLGTLIKDLAPLALTAFGANYLYPLLAGGAGAGAASQLAFSPEMIAAGSTPGGIGAAGAAANLLTDAQLASLYGVNSGIATLAPALSELPSGPPSTPGTPPPPGLEPPIPSGIETLPSGPPGTPGTPPPPPSGIETLPSGPPSTPGTPPPPNLDLPAPIESPIPSGPPSTPGTPPPPNLELPTPPELPVPSGPPSTPGTPPPPNLELPLPPEPPIPAGPPSTPGTPPPPDVGPPGTNLEPPIPSGPPSTPGTPPPPNVGPPGSNIPPVIPPVTTGIKDILGTVKDVLGSGSGMGILGLMALMSMMNKGGGAAPASTATIPELTANRTQLPYDVDKKGVNPNTPYRPGQGGVNYFSPTTYTPTPPKAAGGGLMSLGQSNLGSYSDGGRLLQGPGDGVSDSIPAIIGHKQPARLANGEFVIPARIVSELGNGSTDAGAKRLYEMMDRVQRVRRKTKNVAANTKAAKYLPA